MNTKDVEFDRMALPWRGSDMANMDGLGGAKFGDLLATMYQGQKDLMVKYHPIEKGNGTLVVDEADYGLLDSREVQTRIKDLMWRLTEELGEAANCLKNRPHKTTYQPTDVDHFKEEIADALHYFLELLITAGISPEEIFTLYFLKHAVNTFRQDSNY